MKLVRKTKTVWQGKRADGCLVTVEGPPTRERHVWQVNHGTQSDRVHNWFETKGEALKFVVKSAIPCNEWEDIYVVSYSQNGARRFHGTLLGHRNA